MFLLNVVVVKASSSDVVKLPALNELSTGEGDLGIVCTLKPVLHPGQDYFSVFGLQPDCDIDVAELSVKYRQLQQAVHPDLFLRECERSQRLAQQQASLVNTAYQTLKIPLSRGQYLLELEGEVISGEVTVRDQAFLIEQIMLREQLEDAANDLPRLDKMSVEAETAQQQEWDTFRQAWQVKNWKAAQIALDKLQFNARLTHEIEEHQSRLLDG
jgi:molecular chaperone HscB